MTGAVVAGGPVTEALFAAETNGHFTLGGSGSVVAYVKRTADGEELWTGAPGHHVRRAGHEGERITGPRFAAGGDTVFYRHARRGREAWNLSAVRLSDGSRRTILGDGSLAEFWLSPTDPEALVLSRRPRQDLYDASLRPLAANPGYHRWLIDNRLRPRGGIVLAADGSARVELGADLARARTVLTVDADAVPDLAVLRFSRDDERLFLVTSAGSPVRRLLSVTATGDVTELFAHPGLDLGGYPVAADGVWFDPRTGEPDLCAVMDQRLRYQPLTARAADRVAERLRPGDDGTPVLTGRSHDDRVWLVSTVHSDGPLRHGLVRAGEAEQVVAHNRPELVGAGLPGLRDFPFVASDGRPLTGYLLRPGEADGPLPTVVLVHGGPIARDTWRFHAEAQYLAALGYQSLHINFRGSAGFGAAFRLSGYGEWGGRMQQDLYDAVVHGVELGLVDRARVAFLGSSYGGYAALLAACTRPDIVRGAIAVSPPCDLVRFAAEPPAYWRPLVRQLRRQVLQTADGRPVERSRLDQRSPMSAVGPGSAPMLIAHGARDPRIPIADVTGFVGHARDLGVPVTFLRFDDEGHVIHADANRARLYREIAAFLEVRLAAR
ncbi:S9 family peptidase [Actinoplanes sp. LDG1-06]|uniref:S9 family peptidase n=1 Tax=Paractinoplanes ovalisporus TaxID=2810368 RepID=A0ABS2A4L6_9ACTN|nr:alpha/beta fold hydrolase [Actinoplanes ovalisporus]MBM2614785.1 S9 family peptidase [Actinoplanes ovalisporus]